MNYRVVLNVIGKTLIILAGLMCVPLFVGVFYKENTFLSFLIPIFCLLVVGFPLSYMKVRDKSLYAKEGFVIVALCWIIMSLVGALPFVISKEIPNFFDAFFETVSGFTTTGASVLTLSTTEISLSKSIMFWRIFTHWIGGMGVLVFLIAVLPANGNAMHILRAESPGPSASKLVSKITYTARILYGIYIVLTILEIVMLLFSGMGLYEALLNSFATAGTGGFGVYGDSIAHYNSVYVEMVIASFMFLFGINFNLFYLIVMGHFLKAIKSEEFLTYLFIVVFATLTIAIDLTSQALTFSQALRYSFFQTASIGSTTGFATANFASWPQFSKTVLLFLTITGACGGSTCGGIKISRAIILFKICKNGVKKSLHPRAVINTKLEGETLSKEIERNTCVYFIMWVMIVIACTMLLALDSNATDVFTNFSATLACMGNVGPGLTQAIGPSGSFANFNAFSKTILSIVMLVGRLEILPMIILFAPRTWRKG